MTLNGDGGGGGCDEGDEGMRNQYSQQLPSETLRGDGHRNVVDGGGKICKLGQRHLRGAPEK